VFSVCCASSGVLPTACSIKAGRNPTILLTILTIIYIVLYISSFYVICGALYIRHWCASAGRAVYPVLVRLSISCRRTFGGRVRLGGKLLLQL
jgi:hypothetical protein